MKKPAALLLLVLPLFCTGQPSFLWEKQPVYADHIGGNDFVTAVQIDAAGNTIAAGSYGGTTDFDPSAGTYNLTIGFGQSSFIAKYTPAGALVWAKQINGNLDCSVNAITLDAAGNIYCVGTFSSAADFDPGPATAYLISTGGKDVFLARYDASGNYQWAVAMASNGVDEGMAIALDGASIVVGGTYRGTIDLDPSAAVAAFTNSGNEDAFLAKYSSAGGYQWGAALSSSATEAVAAITTDGTGGVYITGGFGSGVDFDPGPGVVNAPNAGNIDVYLAKYSSAGALGWVVPMGGANADNGRKIHYASGNLYVAGTTTGGDFDPGAATVTLTSAGGNDAFFARYNASTGAYGMAFSIGGTGQENVSGIRTDASGNIYLAGTFASTVDFDPGAAVVSQSSTGSTDAFLAKYSSTGAHLWSVKTGSSGIDEGMALALDAAGNPLTGGTFSGLTDFAPEPALYHPLGPGGYDGYLQKLSATGTFSWAAHIGAYTTGQNNNVCRTMASGPAGSTYAGISFLGTHDFDPGSGITKLSSTGGEDVALLKYDRDGGLLWAKQISGVYTDQVHDMAADAAGNLYVTGTFYHTADFDPGPGTTILTSAGYEDAYIAKYDPEGALLWAYSLPGPEFSNGARIAVSPGGDVSLFGPLYGTIDVQPGSGVTNLTSSSGVTESFLAKYTTAGALVWAKYFDNSSGGSAPADVQFDGSGMIVVAGTFSGILDMNPDAAVANVTSSGNDDMFIGKYNAGGVYQWASRAGNTNADQAAALAIDAGNNIVLTGNFLSATIAFGATILTNGGSGTFDALIAKYSPAGVLSWAKNIGGTNHDVSLGVAVNTTGEIFLAGYYNGACDFDPSAATAVIGNAGGNDFFLAKYTGAGGYVWAGGAGSFGSDIAYSVLAQDNGAIVLGGTFQVEVDFDFMTGNTTMGAEATTKAFVARYLDCNLALPTAPVTTSTHSIGGAAVKFYSNCSLIADLSPSGASPVSGPVAATVRIDGALQSYNGRPYVQRHYDIDPPGFANPPTGTVTLYFTQADFDAYNAAIPGTAFDIPAGGADATGKSHLRITQYRGASATFTPGSYTG